MGVSPFFRPVLHIEQDAIDAANYWRDREVKVYAVDVVAGPARRLTYGQTFYCRARTGQRAIAAIQDQAIGPPKGARYSHRLAGPRELGCVPAPLSERKATMPVSKAPRPYLIRIAPSLPVGFLAAEPDEDDDEPATTPPRTADVELALQFSDFTSARRAAQNAVKRWPSHAFHVDVA